MKIEMEVKVWHISDYNVVKVIIEGNEQLVERILAKIKEDKELKCE